MGLVIRNYDVGMKMFTPEEDALHVNVDGLLVTPTQKVYVHFKEILTSSRDTRGRSRCVGYDMKFEWEYQNNSNVDIKLIHSNLKNARPIGEVQLIFTDPEGEAGTITIGTLGVEPVKVVNGVTPIVIPKIDGNGAYESLKLWADKIMSVEKAMAILGNEA